MWHVWRTCRPQSYREQAYEQRQWKSKHCSAYPGESSMTKPWKHRPLGSAWFPACAVGAMSCKHHSCMYARDSAKGHDWCCKRCLQCSMPGTISTRLPSEHGNAPVNHFLQEHVVPCRKATGSLGSHADYSGLARTLQAMRKAKDQDASGVVALLSQAQAWAQPESA